MKFERKFEQNQNVRHEIKNKSGFSTVRTVKKATCIIAIALVLVFSASFLVEAISSFVAENYTAENLGEGEHVEPIRWEGDDTDWLNRQFAVSKNGGYQNMTDITQMADGTSMYVLIQSNYEGHCTVCTNNNVCKTNSNYNLKGFLAYTRAADDVNNAVTGDPYGVIHCKQLDEFPGQNYLDRFVWKITRVGNYFTLSPKLNENYYITREPGTVTVKVDNGTVARRYCWAWADHKYSDLAHWEFTSHKDSNDTGDTVYNIRPRNGGNLEYLGRYICSDPNNINTSLCQRDAVYPSTVSALGGTYDINHGANEWSIFPILHNNKDVTYGYIGAASYENENRTDVSTVTTTVMSLYNRSLVSAKAYYADLESAPVMRYGCEDSHLFDVTIDSHAMWTKFKANSLFDDQTEYKYVKGSANNTAYIRTNSTFDGGEFFWSLYSFNANGGYYIAPLKYDNYPSYSTYYNDVPSANTSYDFRTLHATWEAWEGNTYLYAKTTKFSGNNSGDKINKLFWIETKPKVEITVTDQKWKSDGTLNEAAGLLDFDKDPSNDVTNQKSYFWFGSAVLEDPNDRSTNVLHTDNGGYPDYSAYGYKFWRTSDYIVIHYSAQVTPDALFRQRHYKGIDYQIVFNGNTNTHGSTATINAVYDEPCILTENGFEKKYALTYNSQGGESVDSNFYNWTFKGWATSQGSDEVVYTDLAEVSNLTTTDSGIVNLYAVWEAEDMELPSPRRANHALYGWNESSSNAENVFKTISGIEVPKTYYAWWAGADLTQVSEKSGTLTVQANIYGNGTNSIATLPSDAFDVKWERINSDSKVFVGAGSSYTTSLVDAGYAVKCSVYSDGALLDYAFSKLIPTNIPVDTTPAEEENLAISGTVASGKTYFVNINKTTTSEDLEEIVSGIQFTGNATYKVYGMWGNSRILLFDNSSKFFNQDNTVSFEGVAFEKYAIVSTSGDIDLSSFKMMVLPRVYKPTVAPLYTQTTSVDCIVELKNQNETSRASDNDGNNYFYADDKVIIKIDVGSKLATKNSKKLVAGSYVLVNGKTAYPSYSNSSDGFVVINGFNDSEVALNKASAEDITLSQETVILTNLSTTTNSEGLNHNINLGTVEVDDSGSELGFTTMWYLDDEATDHSWHRGNYAGNTPLGKDQNGFGSYIVRLSKLLKVQNDTNDFYVYLCGKIGKTEADALAESFNNGTYTLAQRKVLVGHLEDFINYWNTTYTNKGDDVDRADKMSFGENVEIDVVAYNYYLSVQGDKRFIKHTTYINVPTGSQSEALVYIPYASYTYKWNEGYFTPRSNKGQSVYVYGTPSEVSTLNGTTTEISVKNVEIAKGGTLPLEISGNYSSIYFYTDADANVSFNGNNLVATNANVGTYNAVAMTAEGHKTTFKITVVEAPVNVVISDVNVFVGVNGNDYNYPAAKFVPYQNGLVFTEELVYSYDTTVLTIENNTAKGLVVGQYIVTYSYKGVQIGSFKVNVVGVDMETDEFINSKISDRNTSFNNIINGTSNNLDKYWSNTVNENTTVFMGDSLFNVTYWDNFYSAAHFEDDDVVLLGINNSRTYDWEKFIVDGGLDDVAVPKNIVLNIGTANVKHGDTAEKTIYALQRFFIVLNSKFPNTNLYWFEISPRNNDGATYNPIIDEVNAEMSKWCAENGIVTALKTAEKLGSSKAPFENNNDVPVSVKNGEDSYWIFTQAIAYSDIEIMSKGFQIFRADSLNTTDTFKHNGEELTTNYVIEGKLYVNDKGAMSSDGRIQFALQTGADVVEKHLFALWSYDSAYNNSYFNMCFDNKNTYCTTYNYFDNDPIDYKVVGNPNPNYFYWRLVVTDDDAYFYSSSNGVDYVWECVYVNFTTGIANPRLVIGAKTTGATFSEMKVISGEYDNREYEEILDTIRDDIARITPKTAFERYY